MPGESTAGIAIEAIERGLVPDTLVRAGIRKLLRQRLRDQESGSCEEHVNHEVNKLNGIINSTASFENGNAVVEFDRTKTNETEVEIAINATGYKVISKK